tara:strand:- start:20 stop:523 length:504 start_codon:yes stop_codon:yes gene_type:complete
MSTLEVKGIQAPSGFDLDMPAGHIVQTVYGTYSTIVSLSSTSYVDSGLSLSITPKFSTSKIYIIVNQQSSIQSSAGGTDGGFGLRLLRDSTVVFSPATNYDVYLYLANSADTVNNRSRTPLNYLDSPATTSTITYKTQASSYNPTNGPVNFQNASNPSNITLMEVAG